MDFSSVCYDYAATFCHYTQGSCSAKPLVASCSLSTPWWGTYSLWLPSFITGSTLSNRSREKNYIREEKTVSMYVCVHKCSKHTKMLCPSSQAFILVIYNAIWERIATLWLCETPSEGRGTHYRGGAREFSCIGSPQAKTGQTSARGAPVLNFLHQAGMFNETVLSF